MQIEMSFDSARKWTKQIQQQWIDSFVTLFATNLSALFWKIFSWT